MKIKIGFWYNTWSVAEQMETQWIEYKEDVKPLQKANFQKHGEMVTRLHLHRFITDGERIKIMQRFMKKFVKCIQLKDNHE